MLRVNEIPQRALTFRVHFNIQSGVLRSRGSDVGRISGTAIVPLQAAFRSFPPPGAYLVDIPDYGVPELIIETMGSVDAAALLASLDPAPPQECLEDVQLEAELEFQSVQADDEWVVNEPADIDAARTRFEGRWRLTIPFPLGFGFKRGETQLSMDRRDYELEGNYAQLVKA